MPRNRIAAAHPDFNLLDHLQVLFLSLCPCLCLGSRPTSPSASPRSSAELDALLDEEDDNDRSDAVSLHSQYGRGRGRHKALKRAKEMSIGGFSLFGRRGVPAAEELEDERATSVFVTGEDNEVQGAQAMSAQTLRNLPELARKWEPSLTLEDLQVEEARLEELERKAERAGGLDIYSPPTAASCRTSAPDDDFGDFETAPPDEQGQTRARSDSVRSQSSRASSPPSQSSLRDLPASSSPDDLPRPIETS